MREVKFVNGMTVSDLKKLISDWPEVREDGDPCEVWVGNSAGHSRLVRAGGPLNLRHSEGDGRSWADLILIA